MNPNHRKWTYKEEQILRDNWDTHTIEQVAKMVNRSFNATYVRAYQLGLKKTHYGLVWTPQQLKILRDHFPTMFNRPLAKWIGVSVRSMIRKARELGLEKKPGFLDERRRDIQELAAEGLRKCTYTPASSFKKGVRNNPSGEFKKGHKLTPEAEAKRIESLKHRWKIRKARLELDKNLHPEKYY